MESVAIYCRLSKDDGDDTESNSIKTQKMIIESFCKKQGWNIYNTYVDDGFSGMNFDRPEFQRMRQDIVDAKVNVVISKDLSRLGRNYILTGYYYQVFFPEAGVRYIAVNDHIDTKYENSDMALAAFKNIMNDLHVKLLGKNIKAARRARIENKQNCFCIAPYGYRFNSDHVLSPDADIVPIVRFIYEEYVRNPNAARIAKILNERGVSSRSMYFLENKFFRSGAITPYWKSSAPLEVIRNPAYMGALAIARKKSISPYSQKTVIIPLKEQELIYNCHEAMVSRELWEAANDLSLRPEIRRRGYAPPKKETYKGKLYCAHCGNALEVRSGAEQYSRVNCKCWPPGDKLSYRTVSVDTIDRHLVSEIRKLALLCEKDEGQATNFILDHLDIVRDSSRVEIEIEIAKTQKRIENLREKISSVSMDDGIKSLTPTDKTAILNALETSCKEEEGNLEKLRGSDCVKPSGSDIDHFIRSARRYGYISRIDRPVLDELVEKVYITKKTNISNYQQNRVVVKYKNIGVLTGIYMSQQ